MSDELGDFTAPDRLQFLVDFLTENGKNNHRFENGALLNTSKWVLAGGFPKDCLRYYAYPSSKPVYVFIVEGNDSKHPHVFVRTPSSGHDSELLERSLKALLKELEPALKKHGHMILECDTTVRAAFFKLQSESAPFKTEYTGEFIPFYVNEQQKEAIVKEKFTAPDGYTIGTINVAEEYEFIHKMWPYGSLTPSDTTRQKLANLPSVCIRDSEGQLASWELTHTLGAITHLFTVDKHRGKGLGVLTENLLTQIFIRQGLHVFKYVSNVAVVKGTLRHHYWSQWKSLNDDDNQGDEQLLVSFSKFSYTGN